MAEVIVYSKPKCTKCEFTKRVLDKKGIEYEVRDVEESDVYLNEIVEMGFKGLPVVVIDGMEPFTGFKPDILEGLS